MKAEKLLLPIGAIIALYLFLAAKAVSTLNYFIQGVALKFDGFVPVLNLSIGIQNVSNESFEIRSFVGNLILDGQTIGTISSFAVVPILPASQTIYPISVRLSVIGAVTDIISLLQGNSGAPKNIDIVGNVNASGVVAPVNLSYKIGM